MKTLKIIVIKMQVNWTMKEVNWYLSRDQGGRDLQTTWCKSEIKHVFITHQKIIVKKFPGQKPKTRGINEARLKLALVCSFFDSDLLDTMLNTPTNMYILKVSDNYLVETILYPLNALSWWFWLTFYIWQDWGKEFMQAHERYGQMM